MTCDDCRWKIERKDCPWNFDYDKDHDYAEDCCDFRNIKFPEDAFNADDGYDGVKLWTKNA